MSIAMNLAHPVKDLVTDRSCGYVLWIYKGRDLHQPLNTALSVEGRIVLWAATYFAISMNIYFTFWNPVYFLLELLSFIIDYKTDTLHW